MSTSGNIDERMMKKRLSMKKNISIQGIFLGAVMLLGMSVSCQDDIEQQGHGASADRILLSIGEGSSVGSRSEAGVWSNRYLMTVGKDSLFVGLTEEVNAVAVESIALRFIASTSDALTRSSFFASGFFLGSSVYM